MTPIELDYLVGEALGLDVKIVSGFVDDHASYASQVCVEDLKNVGRFRFHPSGDFEDAFEAAEKAELFVFGETEQDGSRFLDRVIDGGVVRWRICQHRYKFDIEDPCDGMKIVVLGTGDTIPLAICNTIVALAKK